MRSLITTTAAVAAAMVLVIGCGGESAPSDPASGGDPAKPVAKGDCPNCDPAGPGAFVQAELDTRWYVPGDKWHVAFQFRNRGMMSREDFLRPTQKDQWVYSGAFLFEYVAVAASSDEFGGQMRDIIEIEVTQVNPYDVGLGEVGYFETERVDTHEHKVRFRMNDMTDALDVTYFGRQYPNGLTVAAPSKAALSLPTSLFPVNVPRLLVGGANVVAPELPDMMALIGDSLDSEWRTRSYKRYVFRNGDVVYWAPGFLWPFYIENAQGRGLLIDGKAN